MENEQGRPRSAFARQLDAWMALADLNDTQLARKVRVSKMTIGRWRLGRNVPRPEKIPALARALNVTEDEIRQLIRPIDLLPADVRSHADTLAALPPERRKDVLRQLDEWLGTRPKTSGNGQKVVFQQELGV